MAHGKHPTPDGRFIDYSGVPAGAASASPERALEALQPFIDACLAVLPASPLSGNERLGLFLFLLGAADRMWQRYGLDDRRFPGFAAQLLQAHGVPASAAASISFALPQLRRFEPAHEIMIEGAGLFEEWVDAHDTDAVLRLTQLLSQWGDLDLGLDHPD